MPKYLFSYHGGGMSLTEEEQAQSMAAWGMWMGGLGAALADGGSPVVQSFTVQPDGSSISGGGPNPVTGYSVVSAPSFASAMAMAAGCPILTTGGSVEVGETIEIM